jgi:outer membrane lipoprotein
MKRLHLYLSIGAVALGAVAGCSMYPITRQYRQHADWEATVPMVQKDPQTYKGATVIWGGFIIDDRTDSSGSTLTILESPLDYEGYPKRQSDSRGRFIAETDKFLDPLIFKAGKRVTLAATVDGTRTEKLGEGTYAYPVVKLLQLRYWEYEAYSPYPYGYPYYHPWWHHGYGYGWPYYDYYWGGDIYFYDQERYGRNFRGGRMNRDGGGRRSNDRGHR